MSNTPQQSCSSQEAYWLLTECFLKRNDKFRDREWEQKLNKLSFSNDTRLDFSPSSRSLQLSRDYTRPRDPCSRTAAQNPATDACNKIRVVVYSSQHINIPRAGTRYRPQPPRPSVSTRTKHCNDKRLCVPTSPVSPGAFNQSVYRPPAVWLSLERERERVRRVLSLLLLLYGGIVVERTETMRSRFN